IVLRNVELDIDDKRFLAIDTIRLGYTYSFYDIFKQIAAKDIRIEELQIIGLNLRLNKDIAGGWNYGSLIRTKDKNNDKESENTDKSSWKLRIRNFKILKSQISVKNNPELSPKIIDLEQFHSLIVVSTYPFSAEVKIKSGDFNVKPYGLNIDNMSSSRLKLSKKEAVIGDLGFDVNGSTFALSGELVDSEQKLFTVRSNIDNFVYENIKLNMNFEGNGKYSSINDIKAQFNLRIDKSEYSGNKFSLLANDIKVADSVLRVKSAVFDGDMGTANISLDSDLKKIFDKGRNNEFSLDLALADLDYSKISKLKARLSDKAYEKVNMILNADIKSTGFFNAKDDFDITSQIDKFSLRGGAGNAELEGVVNASDKLIKSNIDGELNDFNLEYVLAKNEYKSSINSKIDIDAVLPFDLDIKQLSGSSRIKIQKSTIFDKQIDSGAITAKFSPNIVENVLVKLNSDFLNINATGKTDNEKLDFSYSIEGNDLGFIGDIKEGLDLEGSVDLKGKVKGDLQTPSIDYSLNISDFGFKDLKAAFAKSMGTLSFNDGVSAVDSNGKLENIKFKNREFESLDFKVSNHSGDLHARLLMSEDDTDNYELKFKLPDFKDKKKVEFQIVIFNMGDAEYQNADPFYLDYSDGIKIDGFNLKNKDSSIKGNIDYRKNKNINGSVELDNFELTNFSELLDTENAFSGILNGKINLTGSPESPELNSRLRIEGFSYKEFFSSRTVLNSSYGDKKFKIKLDSDLKDGNKFNISGIVNSLFRFDGMKPVVDVSALDLSLYTNNMNLSPFSSFTHQLEDINGYIDLDLKIKGSPGSPKILGTTTLEGTELKLKELKNRIRIDSGELVFSGDSAKFNNFLLKSGDGQATFSGVYSFADLGYSALADFEQFRINPRRINTNLTGNLELTGTASDLYAKGKLRLGGTRINISEPTKQEVSEIKFVDETEDQNGEIVIKDYEQEDYFKDNVALDLDITIPKNSWVRGRGANVELKGGLKIDKEHKDDPVITGNISAVRGTYKIFGKLFKIQEGNVNFPGVKELNPLLDITALYNVSDVNVFVGIGGDVKNPQIKLSSDPALQETDIISYLIFGTTSDKLGTGERSTLGQAASGLAGGVALSQLKGVLGDNVSPDVLSVGSGANGPELEVGKYLNDDIYFAYERKSSSDSASSIPTNTVKVEYRLFDFLSVGSEVGSEQSGGDLFLNFEY
ncbi:MAG: translocation/assembly module TamB, partial [Candidatus Dadabacteria bacterium]|nr:translocation/assembly module TamB [Candidatus Dadabacteria bacterium]NIS08875.1 translocation/assembly module TamB [Candidatus Dadabacteria bacterium]NIV42884.1 hypothetical protein [Candidatus Dadabacteria bacterium]NIX15503.1 hypothetical protein [Candidatus Dadabacteria bacterium]NIY22213.1 hypothetical protein [Candidatus Dadabacteria bacterium]